MTDEILELAIKQLSLAFDEFISACVDGDGKPRAPTTKELMQAKACLPPYCKNSFKKKSD